MTWLSIALSAIIIPVGFIGVVAPHPLRDIAAIFQQINPTASTKQSSIGVASRPSSFPLRRVGRIIDPRGFTRGCELGRTQVHTYNRAAKVYVTGARDLRGGKMRGKRARAVAEFT